MDIKGNNNLFQKKRELERKISLHEQEVAKGIHDHNKVIVSDLMTHQLRKRLVLSESWLRLTAIHQLLEMPRNSRHSWRQLLTK